MRCSTLFLLATILAGPAIADVALYSSNPANDALNDLVFSSGPYDGIGDSIILTAADVANYANVQFYNDGAAGTFDASLSFFNAGAPAGTQIGSPYTLTGLSIGANAELNATFQLGTLSVPADVVFILGVSDLSAGVDPGVELYADPTLAGSNTPDTAIFLQSAVFTQQSTGGAGSGNPFFELDEAPEPSMCLVTSAGLLALAGAAWRKRRRS
jgi:hypothetical protein